MIGPWSRHVGSVVSEMWAILQSLSLLITAPYHSGVDGVGHILCGKEDRIYSHCQPAFVDSCREFEDLLVTTWVPRSLTFER